MCGFGERYALKNLQLDKIKKGRPAAIIGLYMRTIWKTVPDS